VTDTTAVPLKERLYRTEAIVLSRTDVGETNRILTIFTPQRGKFGVIAKGVRKPLSRLGPHLEYFTRCKLMLARGRDLDVVTGAETIDAHLGLRTNLEAFGHASHLAEVLNRLTHDRQESEAVYNLLSNSLSLLAEGADPFAVTRHYELVLLSLLGYRPDLYTCVECQTELLPEPNALSGRLGGMVCPRCRGADGGGRTLSVNAQKYLRTLDRHGLAAAVRLPVSDDLRHEMEVALGDYVRHFAERDLASLRIWRALRDAGPAGSA
jgi:DNA repair protein RecO (recombination protein O)